MSHCRDDIDRNPTHERGTTFSEARSVLDCPYGQPLRKDNDLGSAR